MNTTSLIPAEMGPEPRDLGRDVALHIAQIGCFSDPRRRVPEQLLEAWPTLEIMLQGSGRPL